MNISISDTNETDALGEHPVERKYGALRAIVGFATMPSVTALGAMLIFIEKMRFRGDYEADHSPTSGRPSTRPFG